MLAYIVKDKGNGTFEVCFNIDPRRAKYRGTGDVLKILRSMKLSRMLDIGLRLGDILKGYQDELRKYREAQQRPGSRWSKKPKPPQPMVIYILTNGTWQLGQDAKTPIGSLVKQLMEIGMEYEKIWIQFIQFGADPQGTSQLQNLSKELKLL